MSEKEQTRTIKKVGGLFFAGLAIALPILGIILLVTLPGAFETEAILIASGIILILMGIFAYWSVRFFQNRDVLRFPRRFIRYPARLIAVLLVIFSIGTGGIGVYWAFQAQALTPHDTNPYLTWDSNQDPTSGITICWQTINPAISEVIYGLSPTNLNESVSSAELTRFHQIALNGLNPNTTYYYQTNSFPVKHFTTAAQGEFNYTFLWWSDPRTNNGLPGALTGPNLPKIMSKLMDQDGTDWDFSLFTGDASVTATNNDTWRIWVNDLTSNDFASTRPHVSAPGNHERGGNKTAEIFMQYYPYDEAPGPAAFCRSFNYGNTHFVIMDPWDLASGWWGGNKSTYANWLRADLVKNSGSKFIVMAMHPNPVLIGGHSGNQTPIMEVAREFGVDLILCGHHHSYKMYEMNGTEIEPTAKPLTRNSMILMQGEGGNSATPWIGTFSQIDISSEHIRIRSRDVNGNWMDEFLITGV